MRDLRRYARQTNLRLVAGIVILVFTLGLGLIYAFYGPGGALTGLVCLAGAFVPVLLVWASLWAIDRFVRRVNRD
jgi:multisubunit Na+/H+ antiporter MnhB subunit